MRVHVFGSVGASDGDGRVLSVGGPKQRTVLAMLCMSRVGLFRRIVWLGRRVAHCSDGCMPKSWA